MKCPYHDKALELLRLVPNAEAAYQAFQICEVEECFGEDPTLIQCSRTATWRETQGRLVCDMHSNPNSYRELLCRPKQIDDIEIYVNGRAGNIKWSFVTTKLEWEFLVVKLLRNNTSFSTGFLRKMEDAGIDEEFEDENLHVINVIGQSHVCYCPEIIAAAKLLSEFHKDEVVCMSRLRAFDSIGTSIYQRIDKYARYRANAPPLIFNVEVTQSFVDIVARYGSIEVGHNDLRFLHKNRPLSQDLILSKINKITYFDPRTGSKKTKHCEKHGTEVHHIKEHTTKFVTKPKGKKAVTTITHYKGQKGIFTTFNAMVWTPKHYKHYLPYIKSVILSMSIIMRFKKIIVDVFPRDLLYIIFKFLLIAEYQDVSNARIKKNFYHLDYCDECCNIDTLIGTKCITFSKIKPDTAAYFGISVAWPGDENEFDEDEEEIKKIRAKLDHP